MDAKKLKNAKAILVNKEWFDEHMNAPDGVNEILIRDWGSGTFGLPITVRSTVPRNTIFIVYDDAVEVFSIKDLTIDTD